MDRRDFLRLSALATSGAALAASVPGEAFADAETEIADGLSLEGATIAQLQAAMTAGHLTAARLAADAVQVVANTATESIPKRTKRLLLIRCTSS